MAASSSTPPPLPADWFVAVDGQPQGPLTLGDLVGMARQGQLLPQTLVWKEGMAEWREAQAVAETARLLGLPAPGAPSSSRAARPQLRSLPGWAVLMIILGGAFVFYFIFTVPPVHEYIERIRQTPEARNKAEMKNRATLARARADLRTMAIAMETYFLDFNDYPAFASARELKARGRFMLDGQPGFRIRRDGLDQLATLTTPISYISGYFEDPFAASPGPTFSYWTPPGAKKGFIVWSMGPDGAYDLSLSNIAQAYDPALRGPTPALLDLTYDPSNGARSRGDLWRIKE